MAELPIGIIEEMGQKSSKTITQFKNITKNLNNQNLIKMENSSIYIIYY